MPLDEVEPAKEIVKRFATGAMSLGSISTEAHETLAIAMNRLGGRSNTGEGGEDPRRFTPDDNGDLRRSAIKQVASGRFGVTIHYLVNSDQLQIKMAQGAKPGEGGQLPGHKVDKYIGWVRHTTPGVGLISPPPHHDIYSIEDLKQLIYDLRCANPEGSVSVKLVSEVGVGTVAAGVAKANADHVLISGHDGGTGASPLSSIQAAGVPWEIGLAETQQTLLKNDLRSRITVQTDGQLKTGRDVAIAALPGRRRVRLLDGAAHRDGLHHDARLPPEHVPGRHRHPGPRAAQALQGHPRARRELLLLRGRGAARDHGDARRAHAWTSSSAAPTCSRSTARSTTGRRAASTSRTSCTTPSCPRAPCAGASSCRRRCSTDHLDWELLREARLAVEAKQPVQIETTVRNVNRCVGGVLSSRIAQLHGADGLPPDTIQVTLHGSAGQSFGGWLAPGVSFTLHGDANDYTGKGLSGGTLAVMPPEGVTFAAEENVIIGNTVLYGATSGRAFFRGLAGERFAVRNSGAQAVVEGVGDHGCEYMTGGRVVVLGPTGRNFAAGMSGGLAFVLDEHGAFRGQGQRRDARPARGAHRGRRRRGPRARRGAPAAHRLAGGPARARLLGGAAAALRQGLPDRLQARAGRAGRRLRAGDRRLMGELGGFLKIERVGVPYEDPTQRIAGENTYKEFVVQRSDEELAAQGARCMDCGVPFCHNGCPLGNLIPDWNDLVYRDRWQDAIRQLHATNNFPEFTGRLCPAPCEAACVLEIREGDAVTIKQIENSIINHAWDAGWVVPMPPRRETGRSVAVVGAGPAGMAAAQQLRRAGHRRRALRARRGGRRARALRRARLQDREDRRRAPRASSSWPRASSCAWASTSASTSAPRSCASSHDAVVLAIGSRVPRDLPVPGRELDGVHFAMDYLYVRNRWVAGSGRRRVDHAPRTSTSSSSAAATPAPTASATRSARAPPRSSSSSCCPSRPPRAPTSARRGRCGR